MLSCKPGRKQGSKEHFAFILICAFPSWIVSPSSLSALGTHVLPAQSWAAAPSHKWDPRSQGAAVLQVRGLWDPPGTGFLMFVTVCPRPPPFQSISVSSSCILCRTELYLTLEEGIRSGATGTYCRCLRKKEQLVSEKKRRVRDAGRKGTDLLSGWVPDMLSHYAPIPWGWAYQSIWESILQIDCNWHSYWKLLLWKARVLLCIRLIMGTYKRGK